VCACGRVCVRVYVCGVEGRREDSGTSNSTAVYTAVHKIVSL